MISLMGNKLNPSRQAPPELTGIPAGSPSPGRAPHPDLSHMLGTSQMEQEFKTVSVTPLVLNASIIAFSGTHKVEKADRKEKKHSAVSIYLEVKVKREKG